MEFHVYTYYRVVAEHLDELHKAGELTDAILRVHRYAGDRTLAEIVAEQDSYYEFDTDVFLRDGKPMLYLGGGKKNMHMLDSSISKPRTLAVFLETVQTSMMPESVPTEDTMALDITSALTAPQRIRTSAEDKAQTIVKQVLVLVDVAVKNPPLDVELAREDVPELRNGKLVLINNGTDLSFKQYRKVFDKYLGGVPNYKGLYCTTNGVKLIVNEVLYFDSTVSEFMGRINITPELWFLAVVRGKFAGRWALGQTVSKEESNEITKASANQVFRKTSVTMAQALAFYTAYSVHPTDMLLIAYRKTNTTYYTIETYEVPAAGDIGI